MGSLAKYAAADPINIPNVRNADGNIHAGAKMLNMITKTYFNDPAITPMNKTLFTFASYNAGPGNISRMRKEAEKRGLDPDKWFNNVELVTAEKIGIETTTYVRNIYKYYTSYKLTLESGEAQRKAREQLQKK